MKKIILILMIILIPAIVFDTMSFFDEHVSSASQNISFLKEVQSYEEAINYSQMFDISLVSYSKYGFATFEATYETNIDELISYGFIYNHDAKASFINLNPRFTNDPYFDQQYAIGMMNVDQVWNTTKGSSNIMIAVVDSGIDTTHEEFSQKISPLSYNSRTKEVGIAYIEDDTGHGTMVAGVIAASHDNSKGIKGVMDQVTLLVIKANNIDDPETLDDDESEYYADSNIIEAIYYAVDSGAHVINLSLGGTYANPLTKKAIDYANERGVLVVAASGNDGDDSIMYPASFEHVISVGSVNQSEMISDFSNFNQYVDLVAPGESIVTTGLNNSYYYVSGTSFAAPQVSGVIGLLLSVDLDQTPSFIFDRLTSSSTDKGIIGKDDYYGYGLVNAYSAFFFDDLLISFETFGGSFIEPIHVLTNQPFHVNNPTKTGHTFIGWYLDSLFDNEFIIGVDTVSQDTTLYAKFEPILINIRLVGFDQNQTTVSIPYGSTFIEAPPDITGYTFDGWYYDASFKVKYGGEEILTTMTFYAKYEVKQLSVAYSVEGNIIYTDYIDYGSSPILFEPDPIDFVIIGWYLDEFYQIPYVSDLLYENLVLYGKVDYEAINVAFYDYDLTTELASFVVSYGSSVSPPNPPIKPNSNSLTFEFTGWSEPTNYITGNMKVYPEFDFTFDSDSTFMIPGVDTIFLGQSWVDAGVFIDDSLLELIIDGEVDENSVGRYILIYKLYYQNTLLDYHIRSVHVIEDIEDIEITINPTISTLFIGDDYNEQGATTSIGQIEIISDVNTQSAGIYEVIYRVEYKNQVKEKTLFVYVLDRPVQEIDTLYINKKEEVI